MFLAIDCGNTNTVFALFNSNKGKFELIDSWRINSSDKRTADEYYIWISQVFLVSDLKLSNLNGVCIASVVPEILLNIKLMIRKFLKVKTFVIGEDNLTLDININIDHPSEAGADRLVNACAIKFLNLCPAIVIDFGTATTFDLVGKKGSYEGGIIAPGVNLSIDALYFSTSRLPKITIKRLIDEKKSLIGKNTISAMHSGIYWGYVCMVEGLISKLKKTYKNYNVIATGGLSDMFTKEVNSIDLVRKDLTLTGLAYVYTNQLQNQ